MHTVTYPTAPLSALSEDARALYDSVGEESSSIELDRDWLHKDASRMSAHAFREHLRTDPNFSPSERLAGAMGELVDAGYAWHSHGRTYGVQAVVPDLYTVAHGESPWVVRVHEVQRAHAGYQHGARLIAVLDGAEISNGSDIATVQCTVPEARDEEHDPAYSARVRIAIPTPIELHGDRLSFFGVVEEMFLYPIGVDPRLRDTRNPEREIEQMDVCDSEHCQGDGDGRSKHYFAPYLPPRTHPQKNLLRIEAHIRRETSLS